MGLTESQVRRLIRGGRLAHVAIGSRPMVPRQAMEQFVADNTVTPCLDEIQDRAFDTAVVEGPSTFVGPSAASTASAARALRIAETLKAPSRTSSAAADNPDGRVIPLRS